MKFIADRLESFVSDVHAREAKREAAGLRSMPTAIFSPMDVAVLSGMGAYSSLSARQSGRGGCKPSHVGLTRPIGCRTFSGARARLFPEQGAEPVCCARCGQPIATTVTEQLLDLAARKLGIDPAELPRATMRMRREEYQDASPRTTVLERAVARPLPRASCWALMDYDGAAAAGRRSCASGVSTAASGLSRFASSRRVWAGPSTGRSRCASPPMNLPAVAGAGRRSSAARPASPIRGRSTMTALPRQIVGESAGVDVGLVIEVVSGDTAAAPFGGGAWASRGASLGGEAAASLARC